MFYRAAFPITSYASQSSVTGPCDDNLRFLRSVKPFPLPIFFKPMSLKQARTLEHHIPPVDHSTSLFPWLSLLFKRLSSSAFDDPKKVSWPPRVSNPDSWILDDSNPLVPEGKGSRVILARSLVPYAPLRIAALGPHYMRAVALLWPHFPEVATSEASWPETESSLEFTDLSVTDIEYERVERPFRTSP